MKIRLLILFLTISSSFLNAECTDYDATFDIDQKYFIEKMQSFEDGKLILFYFKGRFYQATEILFSPTGPYLSRPNFCTKCMKKYHHLEKTLHPSQMNN